MIVGRLCFALACLAAVPGLAAAASIDRLDVERDSDTYRVVMEATLDAPAPAVWAVLTDLPHLGALSPAFREVEILRPSPPGAERVRTLARFCVLFVCRDIRQVQDFRRLAPGELHALVDPALSDLRAGEADWRLERRGAKTHLHFRSRIVPRFWVPPLIGPWAIRRGLSAEAKVVVASLERIARETGP
jgi:hypothetical protein